MRVRSTSERSPDASGVHGVLVLLLLLLGACGGGGGTASSVPSTEPTPTAGPGPTPTECAVVYDGTFAAIQDVVFARHGCTADACHGSAQSGALDLRPDAAYANLIEVTASGVAVARVNPGDNDRSYLWLKLAAKTRPGSVEIGGSPMPVGPTTLSEDELELVRLWIKGGAPATGTVLDTADLLDGCVPDPEPITIPPLPPPPAGQGVQLVMPAYELPAATEREVCLGSYYDVSEQVPPEFLDDSGTRFRIDVSELRQDPQSHHLVGYHYGGEALSDFGEFTCRGGERAGEPCAATDLESCGDGFCASPVVDAIRCVGFGPPGAVVAPLFVAQQAQERQELSGGVYAEIPVRGLWVWNSHSFNLTTRDHLMNGRINYWFAADQTHRVQRIFGIAKMFGQSTPPYGSETLCTDHTFPPGTRLFNLLSHTHKRGKRFWVESPDGNLLYENFVYNDPVNQYYDPPIAFDSPVAADRTLHYCAVYENGVGEDESPDPATVKRRSTTPPNAENHCEPVACTAGRVGAACDGQDDDAACDSTAGAGDGECDACVLTGGNSTEDEMLILLGAYYVDR
jgi:hypothetical protein